MSFSKSIWFIWDMKFKRKASEPMVVRPKLSRTDQFPSWVQSQETSWGSQTIIDASLRVMLKLPVPSMIKCLVTMQLIRNEKFNGWMNARKHFDMLKVLCTSSPILAFVDFTKPFKLHTDASTIGLGAVLYQEQDGKERVIAYASRCLSKSEHHYLAQRWNS